MEENSEDLSRIYVIPITIRANSNVDESDYINFTLNAFYTELLSDFINSYYRTITTLTESDFDKLKKISQSFECPICMENYSEGIELNCKHIYCEKCIKEWLTKNKKTCPNCRNLVVI